MLSYNDEYHWDTKKIMDRKRCAPCRPVDRWFDVKDVGVNSVYAAGWGVLQHLALAINDTATAELCANEAATSSQAILSKMYVPALKGFRSLFVDWDGQEKISTPNVIQNLFPLLLPLLPQDFVVNLVDEVPDIAMCHTNRSRFSQVRSNSKFNSTFVLPTVAVDDPKFCATFDADLMWRGPVWGFTNWLVMEGLQTHGYDDEVIRLQQAAPTTLLQQHAPTALQVNDILDRWVALVRLSGIWEVRARIACGPSSSLFIFLLPAALQPNYWAAVRSQRCRHVHFGMRLDSKEACSAVSECAQCDGVFHRVEHP
jgi:hypothetical protein